MKPLTEPDQIYIEEPEKLQMGIRKATDCHDCDVDTRASDTSLKVPAGKNSSFYRSRCALRTKCGNYKTYEILIQDG